MDDAKGPTAPPATFAEALLARGTGHGNERVENSVMEGLPQAKADRVASVYRELAELQHQLSAAQQRIATEMQARADDAERVDELEAELAVVRGKLTARDGELEEERKQTAARDGELDELRKQTATRDGELDELRKQVATRDGELDELRKQTAARDGELEELRKQAATRDGELDELRKQIATRDGELEELRKQTATRDSEHENERAQHREAIATRDGELAAMTAQRDANKADAEKVRQDLETGRTKAREIASQLARMGQEMDGAGIVLPPAERPTRPHPPPPPTPPARTSAATETPKVEAILEVTEVQRSTSGLRTTVLVIAGALLGCAATFAAVKASNASSAAAARPEAVAAPAPAPTPSPVPVPDEAPGAVVEPPAAAVADPPAPPSAATPAVADGTIVLPESANGHRVYVDGKVIDIKSSRAVVPCGSREVRIGSHGAPRTLDVACGGETAVPAER